MKTKLFERLLTKEMTRKEFLLHVGMILITITGIASLIRNISNPNLTKKEVLNRTSFGNGPYGI